MRLPCADIVRSLCGEPVSCITCRGAHSQPQQGCDTRPAPPCRAALRAGRGPTPLREQRGHTHRTGRAGRGLIIVFHRDPAAPHDRHCARTTGSCRLPLVGLRAQASCRADESPEGGLSDQWSVRAKTGHNGANRSCEYKPFRPVLQGGCHEACQLSQWHETLSVATKRCTAHSRGPARGRRQETAARAQAGD